MLKKKIFNSSKEKIFLPKNFNLKDKKLFPKEKFYETKNSYTYFLKNMQVDRAGNINTFDFEIINDFLEIDTLSGPILLKKFFLYCRYFFLSISFFFKKKIKKKNMIIVHNRHSSGYFHWVTDTLPKIQYLHEKKKLNKFKLFLPKYSSNFQKQSLFFLKKKNILNLKKNIIFEIENCLYISSFFPSGSPRKIILQKLRKFFLKKISNNKKESQNIYISRSKASKRRLDNERDFEKKLKKLRFKIIHAENHSFKNQVNFFRNAKLICGLSGAGLSNLIWMKKSSTLIELRPENDPLLPFLNFANNLGINYYYYLCKKLNLYKTTNLSDFKINQNDFIHNFLKNII